MSFQFSRAIAALTPALLLYTCASQGQTQNAPRREVAGIPINYNESRDGLSGNRQGR
jgi:hypothetical protein